jgi:hypothetical protein
MKRRDLTGMIFGRYTVLERLNVKESKWLCKCSCGNIREVYQANLVRNHSQSCGCLSVERISKLNLSHGLAQSPEYKVWRTMKARCYSPNNLKFKNYGGRGITICPEWLNSFAQFISDMGRRPSEKHSIDRIDVNGNYEPDNCKWSTPIEQGRNKRNTHYLDTEWGLISIAEASEKSGVKIGTIHRRIKYGFSGNDLFSKNNLNTNKPL